MQSSLCVCVCVCVQGRRVVEVLSFLKVDYSTLKGLIGNEDGASRCYLVTVATELFLLSGSLEGALNTLRGNGADPGLNINRFLNLTPGAHHNVTCPSTW